MVRALRDERGERREATSGRQYRSPLRAQRAAETRYALIAAAHRLFVSKGWAAPACATSRPRPASPPRRCTPTSRRSGALLQAVIDIAVVGDDRPVAVAERPEFARHRSGPPRRPHRGRGPVAHRRSTNARRRSPRSSARRRPATTRSPRCCGRPGERQRRDVGRRRRAHHGARRRRRPSATVLWAIISPEVYLLLVEESGWTTSSTRSGWRRRWSVSSHAPEPRRAVSMTTTDRTHRPTPR